MPVARAADPVLIGAALVRAGFVQVTGDTGSWKPGSSDKTRGHHYSYDAVHGGTGY